MDWLAILALIVSALVASSQMSKEWRERRALAKKEKQIEQETKDNTSLVPIRGANEAVVALQTALKVAYDNEDRLRQRIVHLELQNEDKDKAIDDLERRVWYCERKLEKLDKEDEDPPKL